MSDFLNDMARASRERAAAAKRLVPQDEISRRALTEPKPPHLDLHARGFDIFAEIKRRAPSAGTLHAADREPDAVVTNQAEAYARGGAGAISVLTEPTAFNGRDSDVQLAASASPLPVMRKDFLVDPYQVYEARTWGASGVLFIARLIDKASMPSFLDAAQLTGQFVLLEIFDESELPLVETAVDLAATRGLTLLVGVNARNLVTLGVDTDRFARLAADLPDGIPAVAESGLESISDVEAVASLGYRAALIGTALMRSPNPARLLSHLVDAGREAATPCA